MRRKIYPDGIRRGGGPHQQPGEEKKEAEACHVQGVAVGVEVGAKALVQKTRQDQKYMYLIQKDLERKLQKEKAKEQKARKEKRVLKGKGDWLNCAHWNS